MYLILIENDRYARTGPPTHSTERWQRMKDSREFAILDVLREERAASVSRLAEAVDASEAPIRRDLDRLDRTGLVRRTHGGAVLVEADAPFAEVERVNSGAQNDLA